MQLKGRRKICLYLTEEAYGKLQTAKSFGQTTNLAISKAIKQLLEKPDEVKPVRRRRICVRMAARQVFFLSRFCRKSGLTLSGFVNLALRKYTPLDPFKEVKALRRKLSVAKNQKAATDYLDLRRGGGSRRQTTAHLRHTETQGESQADQEQRGET